MLDLGAVGGVAVTEGGVGIGADGVRRGREKVEVGGGGREVSRLGD